MKWLILVSIPLVLVLVLVAVMVSSCVVGAGPALAVVEEFMLMAQARDIDGAYALWGPGMVSKTELEDLIDEFYDPWFKNYESVRKTGWDTEKNEEGYTVAALVVEVSYTDGTTLPFQATLMEVDGGWVLGSFYVKFL